MAATALVATLAGCGAGMVTTDQAAGRRLFDEDSFWNRALPSDPPIDRDSTAMVAALAEHAASAHIANSRAWGIPVARASDSDPRYALRSRRYTVGPQPVRCHVPSTSWASTGSDAHLTVVQPDGTACDFWGFERRSGRPGAETVGKLCGRVAGSDRDAWGTMPCRGREGGGATASGFALLGGLLRPQDFDDGPIRHALQIALPDEIVRARPVWPATHSDGSCTDRRCIPEGAVLQLDPRFDVGAQQWPRWKKQVARVLQVHGAYVGDRGGSIAVRAEATRSDARWTRRGVPIDASLADLPWSSLRVLELRRSTRSAPRWWDGD